MNKYVYYGTDKNGAMLQIFEAVAEVEPTPAEINSIYLQAVRQMGIGIPRPTHYVLMPLIEVEQTDEIDSKPLLIHGESNGVVH